MTNSIMSEGKGPLPAAAAGTVALGGSLVANRMGYGALRLTGPGMLGDPDDIDAARRVLRRAVELGVNFIDTADSYGPETNERLIASALHPYPDDLILATKGGLVRPGPDQFDRDARPEQLRLACEGSLRRLKKDRIDLYQLHAPDPQVPLEDSLGELVRMQAEGKIRFIGISNVSLDEMRAAQGIAEIVSVQNRYNFGDRTHDAVLDACEQDGIAFIPWDPIGSARTPDGGPIRGLALEHGLTPGQAAIAWLLSRSPVMLTIPGTSSIEHLEENIAAAANRVPV